MYRKLSNNRTISSISSMTNTMTNSVTISRTLQTSSIIARVFNRSVFMSRYSTLIDVRNSYSKSYGNSNHITISYEVRRSAVTAAMVKELREQSGAPMMDCKKALMSDEVNGDMKKAIGMSF